MKVLFTLLLSFFFLLPNADAKRKSNKIKLLSVKKFYKLSKPQQKSYVAKIQKIVVLMEKRARVKSPKLYSQNSNTYQHLMNYIIEPAYAARLCAIGGIFRTPRGGKCPTFGRSCGEGDTFKCGSVFGQVCVSRTPIADISDRCFAEAQTNPEAINAAVNGYAKVKDLVTKLMNENCEASKDPSNPMGCDVIQAQLNSLNGTPTVAQRNDIKDFDEKISYHKSESCLKASGTGCNRVPHKIGSTESSLLKNTRISFPTDHNGFSILQDGKVNYYFKEDDKICLVTSVNTKEGAQQSADKVNRTFSENKYFNNLADLFEGDKLRSYTNELKTISKASGFDCSGKSCEPENVMKKCMTARRGAYTASSPCNKGKFKLSKRLESIQQAEEMIKQYPDVVALNAAIMDDLKLRIKYCALFGGDQEKCMDGKLDAADYTKLKEKVEVRFISFNNVGLNDQFKEGLQLSAEDQESFGECNKQLTGCFKAIQSFAVRPTDFRENKKTCNAEEISLQKNILGKDGETVIGEVSVVDNTVVINERPTGSGAIRVKFSNGMRTIENIESGTGEDAVVNGTLKMSVICPTKGTSSNILSAPTESTDLNDSNLKLQTSGELCGEIVKDAGTPEAVTPPPSPSSPAKVKETSPANVNGSAN